MSRTIGVLVIPNEDITDKHLFYRQIEDSYHPVLLQKACKLYGVSPYDEYNSLMDFGCVLGILQMFDDLKVYLPETLSDGQKEYLRKLRSLFSKFKYIDFESWMSNKFHIYRKNGMTTDEVLDWFYDEIDKVYKDEHTI